MASFQKSSDTISLTFSSVYTNRNYVWHLLNRHTVYDSWWPSQRTKTGWRFNSSSSTALWVIRQLEGVWHKPILIFGSHRWLFAADFRKEAALMSCFSWANKGVKLRSSYLLFIALRGWFATRWGHLIDIELISCRVTKYFWKRIMKLISKQFNGTSVQARSCIKHEKENYSFLD